MPFRSRRKGGQILRGQTNCGKSFALVCGLARKAVARLLRRAHLQYCTHIEEPSLTLGLLPRAISM